MGWKAKEAINLTQQSNATKDAIHINFFSSSIPKPLQDFNLEETSHHQVTLGYFTIKIGIV